MIGGYLLYQVYTDETDQKEELEQSLSVTESTIIAFGSEIAGLQQEKSDIEADLASAQADLSEVEAKFLETASSITYGDLLFFEAQVLNLEITDFSASEPYTRIINNIPYETINLTVHLNGNVPSILSYLTIIELAPDFKTTSYETVSIDIPQASEEEEGVTEAIINIQILAYRGA